MDDDDKGILPNRCACCRSSGDPENSGDDTTRVVYACDPVDEVEEVGPKIRSTSAN
eukprot:CAMPEP_0172422310 /NCGR_PEP_ID=MMETSP1064-20121228/8480_1 /TAXON_ID=202472 /ORGANISM="Aulacoseira subarctica , Strain CCAP 1002/5" /LENGTH=55 /DNA_ID=CAMNT_0013163117 /DNA_START=49 /DNA_END=216 /DNA_ORIENTATION=+